ncbi:MAG TPA: putative baseplate assembly protein, partial [Thermomicrobiales bacterium]|nr:putative baseplate assembly protein [Thermomicrobiales bacterium]
DPLQEGSGNFPPKLEDETLNPRLVTWLRLQLPTSALESDANAAEAKVSWVGINAACIYQAVAVVNEVLGAGNGEPEQAFTLANLPVLPASIAIVAQKLDSGEAEQWRLTDDLLAARVDERVFTLDPESGVVQFGDGLHGARPQPGWRVLASYEYGGGVRGNVGIGAVKASRDTRLQGGFTISNPLPTSGGDLGESVDEAERSIPGYLRNRERLVTREDFRDVTMRTPGDDMARVEVLTLFRPGNPPADDVPGVVTVMVVPRFDPVRPLWPTPDRLFLQRVCDHLRPRRLVTTEVYVRGPIYVPVYISAGIQVRAGYFEDEVRATVRTVLNLYLSANPPGGPEQLGWPLNKRLMRKDLEAVVTRVPGVEFVESLELGVGSPVDIPDYDMTGLQLPVVVGLNVVTGVAEPLATVFGSPPPSDPGIRVVPIPVSKATC